MWNAADSASTLLLLETGHRPVYYFPRADVRMDLMAPTSHHTHRRGLLGVRLLVPGMPSPLSLTNRSGDDAP